MTAKREDSYLKAWMRKGKSLGKEPPEATAAPYEIDPVESSSSGTSDVEQLNLKVPKGTKLRLKRLGLEQGGVSMLTIFKRMLDEYEARHRNGQKD